VEVGTWQIEEGKPAFMSKRTTGNEGSAPRKKPRRILPKEWPEEPTEAPEGTHVCKVCFERQVAIICEPCMHALLCVKCARGLPSIKCPMCRTPCTRLSRIREKKIIYC